jgi:hypothetical protein
MTTSKDDLSPEVAVKLGLVAGELRQLVYGERACPEWGTKFSEIEGDAMQLGLALAKLWMQQGLEEQAEYIPPESLETAGQIASPTGDAQAIVETQAGEVSWQQPKAHLKKERRDFFPSGTSTGD